MTSACQFTHVFLDFSFLMIGFIMTGELMKNFGGFISCDNALKKDRILDCVKFFEEVHPNEIGNIQSSYYRSYKFKTLKSEDQATTRWNYYTDKHLYEMINQDTRIGLNGMHRLEVEQVRGTCEQFLLDKVVWNGKDKNFVDLFRLSDPFRGVRYIANYESSMGGTRASVEMLRPYFAGKPILNSIEAVMFRDKKINIILSISKVTERFTAFLARFRHLVATTGGGGGDGASVAVAMTIVVATLTANEDRRQTEHVVALIREFNGGFPGSDVIRVVITSRDFYNKGADLHQAITESGDDEIIVVMDVDMKFTRSFLQRVTLNTIKRQQVFFPVSFSQYDLDIMEAAAQVDGSLAPLVADSVGKETGFWMHYAFGIVAMYKCDYLSVGGYKLDIRGWGVEDVDLYKRFVAHPELRVMWAADRDLVHVSHKRTCDPQLSSVQYQRCIGAWAEMVTSKRQAAVLYGKQQNLL